MIHLMELKKMKKMREFVFWNDKGQEEKTEQMSLTKAVKSIQTKFKDKIVGVCLLYTSPSPRD